MAGRGKLFAGRRAVHARSYSDSPSRASTPNRIALLYLFIFPTGLSLGPAVKWLCSEKATPGWRKLNHKREHGTKRNPLCSLDKWQALMQGNETRIDHYDGILEWSTQVSREALETRETSKVGARVEERERQRFPWSENEAYPSRRQKEKIHSMRRRGRTKQKQHDKN